MSYDFILLHRQPGQSWDEVLEATERRVEQQMDPPFSPSARAWAERIADRLQAHDPQPERFTSQHCIDLDRPDDTGVQVSLFEHELAVSGSHADISARLPGWLAATARMRPSGRPVAGTGTAVAAIGARQPVGR